MRKLRDIVGFVVTLFLLLTVATSAQTAGTKIPGADVNRETWTITIAASDSVSTYFTIPLHTETIFIHFPPLTQTLIYFDAALDSSRVSGGAINTVFMVVRVNTAKRDSILSTPGGFTFDATDILKGALAARIETETVQSSAVTIRVFIRKKPPGL